jgi:NTE family protein
LSNELSSFNDEGESTVCELVPIFAGGGTRLATHIGILTALEELKIKFDHLVGVSGGSIISSLYASGMPLNEIKDLALTTDFNQFRGFSLVTLIRQGGLCSGDRFENWIDKQLNCATFKELPKNLHIVATDVKSGKPVVFDRENTPDIKVSQAVRFSMSIPLVFSFKPFGKHLMVDGSVLSEEALYQDWSRKGIPILCFRLRGEHNYEEFTPNPLFPIKDYIFLLIRTFLTTMSREYINQDFWHHTIIVNIGKVSPVNFNITKEQKLDLFRCGYETAKEVVPWKILKK